MLIHCLFNSELCQMPPLLEVSCASLIPLPIFLFSYILRRLLPAAQLSSHMVPLQSFAASVTLLRKLSSMQSNGHSGCCSSSSAP